MSNAEEVICDSGAKGWRSHLQDNYKTFAEFQQYDLVYKLAKRLGYLSAEEAWDENPLVQGSTNPSDFRKVVVARRRVNA